MKNDKSLQLKGEAEVLISQAIDKNVPVEALERLLAMRRELKAERAKESYDSAMASFQADCPIIQKTKKVSFGTTNYSYAPLEDIVSQVKSILSKNGFSYTFDTKKTDQTLTTFCKVKHIEGHSEVSAFEIALDSGSRMNISQRDGAASSYGKRYAFCNAFGILTGDEDTDAHTSKDPSSNVSPVSEPVKTQILGLHAEVSNKEDVPTIEASEPMITDFQKIKIVELLGKKGITLFTVKNTVKKQFNKESHQDLTISEANLLIEKISAMKDKEVIDGQIDIDEVAEGVKKLEAKTQKSEVRL